MKKWLDPFSTAWVGVVTHKLRSFLTILGIVIGIAAVISLMSIGRGVEKEILSSIESLGSDLIFITPGARTEGGVRSASGSAQTLTQEDAAAIAGQVAHIDSIAATLYSPLQLVVGSENMNTTGTGVPPGYQDIRNLEVAYGAFFTEYDYQRGAKVVVIGSNIKETLFGDANPIGQQIRMGKNIGRIIGVLESKGGVQSQGSPDDTFLIPFTAMRQMVGQQRTSRGESVVHTIELTVSDEDQTEAVVAEITSLLRTRHRLSPDVGDDFNIMSMQEISEAVSEAVGALTLLLSAIAAISLLVGGIGVMNIMLVSVLERTREIGIRKALGARDSDIWIQFLIEAAFISFAGGIIGVILGWAASYAVSSTGLLTTIVTADIVILAVSVAVGIGLFFGFYPAWNASRLSPIDALRSD